MNRIWDRIGICASTLCLIHCLATPFLLLLFPSIKLAGHEHAGFHEIFAIIVIATIMLAVFPNCKKHGHYDIIAISLVGMVCILAGAFLHDMPLIFTSIITVIGSILLIIAHLKNMRVRHGKCASEKSCSTKH